MSVVDRRHLEALNAISAEGTITAAAATLHVSQPTLSRTLSQLETIIGVRLVDRSTHHLSLTEAGRRFLPHARVALTSIDAAVSASRTTAGGVRLGYAWATNDLVAALVSRWEESNPAIEVTAIYDEQPLAALADNAIDVAITRTAGESTTHRAVTLATENRYAALPSNHRFSGRDQLTLAELAAETIVLTSTGTTSLDLWPTHRQPARTVVATSVEDWIVHIATGRGVGVTVESIVRSRPHPNLTYIALSDAEPVDVRLVAQNPSPHPIVADLLASAAAITEVGVA